MLVISLIISSECLYCSLQDAPWSKSPGLAYPEVFYLSETEEFVIMSKEQYTAFPHWTCAPTLVWCELWRPGAGYSSSGFSQHQHCFPACPTKPWLIPWGMNNHATGEAFFAEQKSTFKSQNILSWKGSTRIKSLALIAPCSNQVSSCQSHLTT